MVDSGTSGAVERLVRTSWESYRSVTGVLAVVQEQNMKLARYSTGVFLEGAEKQREAMQVMFKESFKVYMGLLHAPVSPPRNGSNTDGVEDPDLPIEGYDRLSVGEITGELGDLLASEVEELKEYETKNKNRHTLVERFDRSLV